MAGPEIWSKAPRSRSWTSRRERRRFRAILLFAETGLYTLDLNRGERRRTSRVLSISPTTSPAAPTHIRRRRARLPRLLALPPRRHAHHRRECRAARVASAAREEAADFAYDPDRRRRSTPDAAGIADRICGLRLTTTACAICSLVSDHALRRSVVETAGIAAEFAGACSDLPRYGRSSRPRARVARRFGRSRDLSFAFTTRATEPSPTRRIARTAKASEAVAYPTSGSTRLPRANRCPGSWTSTTSAQRIHAW
jgi:hypothetical protein